MIYIGIDPGLKGALAWYQPGTVKNLSVIDVPTTRTLVNGKTRDRLNMAALATFFKAMHAILPAQIRIIIEDVHSMPLQGVASSFTFGFVAGAIQQAAISAGHVPYLVAPATWKRRLGISADKSTARALASQLFPQYASLWAKASRADRAEAALLAYYGSKFCAA